jgi:hypothetical protein
MGSETDISGKWTWAAADIGSSFKVVAPYAGIPVGFVHIEWDDGMTGIIKPAEILRHYRQDAEPAKGGPGVCAGQRWRWKDSPLVPFAVLSLDGDMCACRYDDDWAGKPPYRYEANSIVNGCTLLDAAPPRPEKQPDVVVRTPGPIQREVSGDGRNWINYDRLTDADPFTSYRHRRENGVVIVAAAQTSVRIIGTYNERERLDDCTDKFCSEDRICHHHVRAEMEANDKDMDRLHLDVEPTSTNHPRQSHATVFGGIWRTR